VTFDTPGEFAYYCLLHGGAGGVGMSARIIVTEAGAAAPPPAEPPAGEEVVIDMQNFAFSETTLTIPVGTTVVWRNLDTVQHSATADDGSFDTGLFDGGQEARVTFSTPGTFAYYCLLHGGPGGVGMSATIVVTG
jgi:plastocyanin